MSLIAWPEERVEELKKLWAAGLSASQIAAELSGSPFQAYPTISRNAAIGKVHRMGLSGRIKPSVGVVPAPRRRRVGLTQHAMKISRPRASAALAELDGDFEVDTDTAGTVAEYDNVIPMAQRLSLLELTEATCHWPIGDPQLPDFAFCGGRALASLPYCAHHTRVSIQPSSEHRRRRPKV